MKKFFLGFAVLSLIFILGVAVAFWKYAHTPCFAPDNLQSNVSGGMEIVFEVKPKESLRRIAENLQNNQLIGNANIFMLIARLRGGADKVRIGEYLLKRTMTPLEILHAIESGKSILHPITLPEGSNIFDIAEILEKSGLYNPVEFLKAAQDPALVEELIGEKRSSLEGYLFPDTYNVTKYTTLPQLLKMMVDHFSKDYEAAQVESTSPLKLQRHELVTLASIIEKETGAPHERPMISSVFHNRLLKRMKMETDPTVIYALLLSRGGQWDKNIHKKDLSIESPYNTYMHVGLPPGPIANPGREALQAAFKPATSEYLFFVSKNDGTHVFTKEYREHLSAVGKFQLDAKAREGRSWRELKQKKK